MKKEFKVKERGLYKAGSDKPFKVSRSGIELFLECSCCFYLNNRMGIRRPSGPPFNINKAVDALLKKEFDVHRDVAADRAGPRRDAGAGAPAGARAVGCAPRA